MRRFMHALFAGLVVVAGIAGAAVITAPPALAEAPMPTRGDAKAITLKAVDLIASRGLDVAAAAFNAEGEFRHGEIYVSVIDFTGVWRVYPPQPGGVGQNVINVQDPDGRHIVQDVLAIAKDRGEGWLEYRWKNPATNKIEPKTSYVKRVPGQELVVYVGVYR